MRKVDMDEIKLKEMENRLGCTFCDDGRFAEMFLELADYNEKTCPIDNVEYGFYQGNVEELRKAVAQVEEDWVQYFNEDTRVFCGYEGEKLTSFCIVDTDIDYILSAKGQNVGAIGCVGTVPQYRRLGIGLRMVDLATLYLKEKGCDVSSISYTHIDKWYSKLGYQTFARFSILKAK